MSTEPATRDRDCVQFLQWCLPRLGYVWSGFRKVRRQVCHRVRRRLRALDLHGLAAYRRLLLRDPSEWPHLDDCFRITISRFYRDRHLWEVLGRDVLPELFRRAALREPPLLRIWSAGCGAGEEPFTVAILLRLGPAPLAERLELQIVATDLDAHQLERARRAVYPESSLQDLPAEWQQQAFTREPAGEYCLAAPYRQGVDFLLQDIRREAPPGPSDLILCRNLVFTYFDANAQEHCLRRLLARLSPHGWLVVGGHESPVSGDSRLVAQQGEPSMVRRRSNATRGS